MTWSKMCEKEVSLAKKWYVEDGESSATIAQRLGRNQSTITRLVVQRKKRRTQGRPPALTVAAVDRLEKRLDDMIIKADGQYEVTVSMLKRSARCEATERTILNKLHARGIYFRPLRQKPTLTADDVTAMKAFALTYGAKSSAWWNSAVHLAIDVKHYRVLPHGSARKHAAQEATRGTYRKKGKGLSQGHTKPVLKSKYNPGAPGIKVLAGVGNGKVLMWEYIDGPWGGAAAEAAYRGPIKAALKREFPGRRSFLVLEDNDPSGFKSSNGRAAKVEERIKVLEIPKRSPCLNICDYFLWSEVNRRMRDQEKRFAASKRETRNAYLKRLRRTALSLPSSIVAAAMGDMKRRCARLIAADGGNIEEGGRQ